MQSIPNDQRLLIIGGGLMGLSLAHALARAGKKVEILSRNRKEAAGFVAAGMLAPHAEGLEGTLLSLGQMSLNQIPQWIKNIESESGIDCGLRNCGIIVPFIKEEDRDKYPTAQFGENLSKKDLHEEIPELSEKWNAGLLFTQDGQIDNRRRLMRALETACVQLGVKFQEGVEVIRILENKKKFLGVELTTSDGRKSILKSQESIICSGAWSKKLLKEVNIFPVKGQMMSIQGPKDALKRIIFGPGTYLVPRDDGLIIIGATSEKSAAFKNGLTPLGQRQLHEGINELLPSANHWPPMERWWGFRPCTPDEMPIIGESSIKGLWLATGHYRNGVLLASITSSILMKCICNLKLEEREKRLLKYFAWDRF